MLFASPFQSLPKGISAIRLQIQMLQKPKRQLLQTLKHQLIVFQIEIGECADGHQRGIVVGGGRGEYVLERGDYYRDR